MGRWLEAVQAQAKALWDRTDQTRRSTSTSTKTQITLPFLNQMPKEVLVILWDQTTAQIFPVHRVLCVSMAALPMNLNARILKQKVKREKKNKDFQDLGAILCAILVYSGFHIES